MPAKPRAARPIELELELELEPESQESPVQIATRLAPIELLESGLGRRVRLAEFWRDRPAVLVFLRHFG